eukprot:COSAG06_NODE_16837_length_977_cov_3.688662_2_plen_85_part_01
MVVVVPDALVVVMVVVVVDILVGGGFAAGRATVDSYGKKQTHRDSLAAARGLAAAAPLSDYASRQHRSLPHHAARARALPARAAA